MGQNKERIEHVLQMLNSNDTKRINKKHCADNAEIIGASLSKLALLENTLTALQTLDNLVQTTAHTSRLTSTAVPAILRILNSTSHTVHHVGRIVEHPSVGHE